MRASASDDEIMCEEQGVPASDSNNKTAVALLGSDGAEDTTAARGLTPVSTSLSFDGTAIGETLTPPDLLQSFSQGSVSSNAVPGAVSVNGPHRHRPTSSSESARVSWAQVSPHETTIISAVPVEESVIVDATPLVSIFQKYRRRIINSITPEDFLSSADKCS